MRNSHLHGTAQRTTCNITMRPRQAPIVGVAAALLFLLGAADQVVPSSALKRETRDPFAPGDVEVWGARQKPPLGLHGSEVQILPATSKAKMTEVAPTHSLAKEQLRRLIADGYRMRLTQTQKHLRRLRAEKRPPLTEESVRNLRLLAQELKDLFGRSGEETADEPALSMSVTAKGEASKSKHFLQKPDAEMAEKRRLLVAELGHYLRDSGLEKPSASTNAEDKAGTYTDEDGDEFYDATEFTDADVEQFQDPEESEQEWLMSHRDVEDRLAEEDASDDALVLETLETSRSFGARRGASAHLDPAAFPTSIRPVLAVDRADSDGLEELGEEPLQQLGAEYNDALRTSSRRPPSPDEIASIPFEALQPERFFRERVNAGKKFATQRGTIQGWRR